MIHIDQIDETFDRMEQDDMRDRFVIDTFSLFAVQA